MEEREPSYTVGDTQIGIDMMENSVKVPLKNKARMTIQFSDTTPGHMPNENHNFIRHMHPNIYCNTIYSNRDKEAALMSNDR